MYKLTNAELKSVASIVTDEGKGRITITGDYIRMYGKCPLCGHQHPVEYSKVTGRIYCRTPGCFRGPAVEYADQIGAELSDEARAALDDLMLPFGDDTDDDDFSDLDLPRGVKSSAAYDTVDLDMYDRVPLPWPDVNHALGGGLYLPSLCVVTGKRGDGKSTMCANVVASAIAAGFKAFIYSGELGGATVATTVRRIVAGREHIITARNENGDRYVIDDAEARSVKHYLRDKLIHYEATEARKRSDYGDVLTMCEEMIDWGCRVILIDNLMTALSDDLGKDLWRQQSLFVKNLANLALDKNALVLLVIHPRKTQNGSVSGSDDVGGVSALTDRPDYVLSYERRPGKQYRDELGLIKTEDNRSDPNRLIKVYKNRLTGNLITDGVELAYEPETQRIYQECLDPETGWDFPEYQHVTT